MPMKINVTHLRKAVKESGFRQDCIAKRCGVSGPQFSRILHGSRKLTADIFVIICYTIGVKMENFVQNENFNMTEKGSKQKGEIEMEKEITLSELGAKIDRLTELLDGFRFPEPDDGGKQYLSIPEAAKLIGVAESTLRTTIDRDVSFPVAIVGEQRKIIPRQKLKQWMDQKADRIS